MEVYSGQHETRARCDFNTTPGLRGASRRLDFGGLIHFSSFKLLVREFVLLMQVCTINEWKNLNTYEHIMNTFFTLNVNLVVI